MSVEIVEKAFNNSTDITGYRIPLHSEDWFKFRTIGIPNVYEGGFGASQCGTITGKNSRKYGQILPVLLNEKAGLSIPERIMNEHMLSGILAEPIIAERWKYFDGTEKGYLQNWLDKALFRECEEVDMYLVNKKYPWLFASLDRKILKNQSRIDGGVLTEDAPLELKQISYFAAQQWEMGVPPQYIYQVQQQMLVTDTDYCELAILQDGYNFKVYRFTMDVDICNEILKKSRKAWEDVLKMRELKEEREYYLTLNQIEKADAVQAHLDSMIPVPDSTEGWKEFLNERFIKEVESFRGTTKDFKEVIWRSQCKTAIKLLTEVCDGIENRLRAVFVRNASDEMEFGGSGKVTYKKVGDRKDPQFNFSGIKRAMDSNDEKYIREILKDLL